MRAEPFPTAPLVACLLLVASACGESATGPTPERIVLTPDNTLLVGVGDTTTLEAEVRDAADEPLPGEAVTWTSLTPSIVAVDPGGRVTAVAGGRGTVEATTDGVSATATVEVWVPPDVDEYVPGTSYWGRNDYTRYIPGRLPVVASAPHGGDREPVEIPDRTSGTVVTDTNTREVALAVRQAFLDAFGAAPHIVVSHLRRTKLDPNREIVEAAQGNAFAENAWHEYHGFIETASDRIQTDFGAGLYLDLHGHGHDVPRLELGYLLSSSELEGSDAALDALADESSIRALAAHVDIPFSQLVRGPASFGGLLGDEGVPSVPSPAAPDPGGEAFFSGGYSTARHGSVDGGPIDGIQIEMHFPGLRDTEENRRAFGGSLAAVVEAYLDEHRGFFLPGLSRRPPL